MLASGRRRIPNKTMNSPPIIVPPIKPRFSGGIEETVGKLRRLGRSSQDQRLAERDSRRVDEAPEDNERNRRVALAEEKDEEQRRCEQSHETAGRG
jgi:hypothetical protein